MEEKDATLRQLKVARQLQRDLSEIFQREMVEISQGVLISVTDVWISRDLEQGKVYVSIFPIERQHEIFDQIQMQSKEIRYLLGKRVRHQLRVVPELIFRLDQSLEEVAKIDSLLEAIHKKEEAE